jgi:hypothetical protein
MTRKQADAGTAPPVGARVERIGSGALGTVIGSPLSMPSAGGALMVRVEWDASKAYARPATQAPGAMVFVSRLRPVEAAP